METIWQLVHYAAPMLSNFANKIWLTATSPCGRWDLLKHHELLPVVGGQTENSRDAPSHPAISQAKNPHGCFYVWQSIQMILQTILMSVKQGQTLSLKIQYQQQIVSNTDINQVRQLGSHFIHWGLCFRYINFIQHLSLGPYSCLLARGLGNLFCKYQIIT